MQIHGGYEGAGCAYGQLERIESSTDRGRSNVVLEEEDSGVHLQIHGGYEGVGCEYEQHERIERSTIADIIVNSEQRVADIPVVLSHPDY